MECSAHGVQLSRSAHAHCTARRNVRSAYMERSSHAWGAAQPQHIPCASERSLFGGAEYAMQSTASRQNHDLEKKI